MKTFFTLSLHLLITSLIFAQAPQGIPYQAVMRNADGSVMVNSAVSLTFMIHDGSATGTVVYQESHALTSNAQGLVSCVVGNGVVSQSNFANINWGSGAKFLHVMMGTTDLGTQQLLSVPYALYSDDVESRVSSSGDTLWVGNHWVIVPGISAANNSDQSNLGSVILSNVPECSGQLISVKGCDGQDSLFFDGYFYDLVEIEGQCWFKENLKSLHFNDGSDIGQVGVSASPSVYVPDPLKYPLADKYGNYYSGQAAVTGKLCPNGWHLPTHCDWSYLESHFGTPVTFQNEIDFVEAGPELITGVDWGVNSDALNSSGFSAYTAGNYQTVSDTIQYLSFSDPFSAQTYFWLGTMAPVFPSDQPFYPDEHFPLHREFIGKNDALLLAYSTSWAEGMFTAGVWFNARCIKNAESFISVDTLIFGCMDVSACNYSPSAEVDRDYWSGGSLCIQVGDPCFDGNANTTNDVVTADCICAGTQPTFVQGSGVTDIDGNFYPSIILGTQEWMQKNLAVTSYRDGTSVLNASTSSSWNTTNGAYGIYGGLAANNTTYGKLYNWYAVNDPRGICPTGWHVPSLTEWNTMEDYLGGVSVAGGKLKTIDGWNQANLGATNESGFTGLPGGYRFTDGSYLYNLSLGQWWLSTSSGATDAHAPRLFYQNAAVIKSTYNRKIGSSIRCVKD